MLSIIIPQYNKPEMTENTIDSVLENTSGDFEIVLVDNGSTEQISNKYKKLVKYVRVDKNAFFAGGCNIGSNYSSGNILCFMNNDIILTRGWDSSAVMLDNREDVGIVGIKLLYPNKTIQHAGIRFFTTNDWRGNCPDHVYRNFPDNYPAANLAQELQAVTGALFFIRKSDFEAVDGFETSYINNYEDIDLCFKVRFNLNKKIIYWPQAEVYHLETQTPRTNENTAFAENHKIFMQRWSDKIKIDGSIEMLRG